MNRTLLVASMVAMSFGCESTWSIRGRVLEFAESSSEGRLVLLKGAKVELQCPITAATAAVQAGATRVAEVDRRGFFELEGRGEGPSLACEIRVDAPGHQTFRTTLDQTCADDVVVDALDGIDGSHCSVASVVAELPKS